MCWIKLCLLFTVTYPAFTSVVRELEDICRMDEHNCNDGVCISANQLCDDIRNCADGSDEALCYSSGFHNLENPVLHRMTRQTSCGKYQWKCRDGSCISIDGICDGVVDCSDGSDETHALCRNTLCQTNLFRCTYGACVDGKAMCNGIQECADNSDELHPNCRSESDDVQGQFKCQDGGLISTTSKCDGISDCADGSDETVRACSTNPCPSFAFRCAYGACVDGGSDCDGKIDCVDGSDEADDLCNKIGPATTPFKPTPKPTITGGCVLPPYPAHGSYVVAGLPDAKPGQAFETVYLNITCHPGYGAVGESSLFCFNKFWSNDIPTCVRFCKLNDHPSVEYRCEVPRSEGGTRACEKYEPSGARVLPKCRAPNYSTTQALPAMKCIDGSWDYVATCVPECGKVTPGGLVLVSGGRIAERGELPWHVGIYKKSYNPYMQICGGSIISTTLVVSAAHCFWNDIERLQPASRFAVAAGKLYRPWNSPKDADAQKSDVSSIEVPPRFRGAETNFQDDIALVYVTQPFEYKVYVRPICVDFEIIFHGRQLQPGKLGKVAGWGLTGENDNASPILKVVELPYISIDECLTEAPPDFREYITSDKICAGYRNGTALCQGDSGGGLTFPEQERGGDRYYLRGIVSTAPKNENKCNTYAVTSFTQILSHELFIKQHYTWV